MKKIYSLNGKWQWRSEGSNEFYEGTVPGSVLSDMLKLGQIQDPFWRLNEYPTRELFQQDYIYRRSFDVSAEDLNSNEVQLICEGLDTIADITLNGKQIAHVNDMHRTFVFDVKQYLKTENNQIEIHFYSSLRYVRHEDETNDIFYASTGCIHGNGALRKAHYMFGWDWGPQLPDAGIFRNIYLCCSNTARLEDVRIRQHHENGVQVEIHADAKIFQDAPVYFEAEITSPSGEVLRQRQDASDFQFDIPSPQLWWPNGCGEHPLYQVKVDLKCGDTLLDTYQCKIGLRTLTVSTTPDEWGSEFAFVVNGIKIFAMGANYVPEDNLIPRVTEERTRRLIADSALANFNCIRVWGGGYYPDDALYDACDENGIIVWQDLMFACNVYALTDDFEQNIIAETRDNVRRLRHHACMGLWCGNNEMEWGWGDEWARIKGHPPRYKADYTKIFELILPRVIEKYDGQTFYWGSSPSSGGSFDDPNAVDRGDQHYWEVWHSGKPFTEYRKNYFRFCSEYGFQSFPHMKTIRSFTLPEDRNIFSEVMESHQKNGAANSKIFTYVSDYFQYPKNLDSISYISQILQLKAIQYGVEHWRRNRGRCMGSLYWQLNDCWPVASWASIDYYGRWKALHYGAKRFYSPLMASACEEEELSTKITYYVHNDTLQKRECVLEVALIDSNFKVLYSKSEQATAEPMQAKPVFSIDFASYIPETAEKNGLFARYRLMEGETIISTGITLFVKPKHFHFPKITYRTDIEDLGDSYKIRVRSTGLSYYAELYFKNIDCVFSDNFFDITSPDGVCVTVSKSSMSEIPDAEELLKQLVIRSVADSYETEETDIDETE